MALAIPVLAQPNTDPQLAQQYYQNGEYEKAAALYEKLYSKSNNQGYYDLYLNCLVMLKDYDAAEKLVRKAIKREGEDAMLLADLGYIYSASGDHEKAKQYYANAVKAMPADPNMAARLANSFITRRQNGFAIDTYLKARRTINQQYNYGFELANLYASQGDIPAMLEEYYDLLIINPGYLQTVQNTLMTRVAQEPEGKYKEMLRTSLLRRVQKYPDQPVFSEMLTWFMIQQKDFDMALLQAKALDKRFNEDGQRVIQIASMAVSNADYDAAINGYQYVIEKGARSPYYITARLEMLNAINAQLDASGFASAASIQALKSNYTKALAELGKSAVTAPLLKGLAHLDAFYLNDISSATALLNEAIALPGLRPQVQAQLKLELGDIYVLTGEVWEATLLYGQVDKAFKNDPLGQEAKLRNAKLSYYTGDFEWAKGQLDVLKSATSQLISNDAMALSLLIADNTALDTSTVAMMMYARADLLEYQNHDTLALAALDSILVTYPRHSLTDEVYYKKATIAKKKGRFQDAADLLQKVVNEYPSDILADDALFQLGDIYEFHLKDTVKAMDYYEQLMLKHPGSSFTVEARKRYRALRGDILN